MHKVLLTHQIVPGKFSELSDWFKEQMPREGQMTLIISLHEGTFTKQEVFLR